MSTRVSKYSLSTLVGRKVPIDEGIQLRGLSGAQLVFFCNKIKESGRKLLVSDKVTSLLLSAKNCFQRSL